MPNFSWGTARPPRTSASAAAKGDAVALDRDVDVEPRLAEHDVTDGAADEIDTLDARAQSLDRLEHRLQARLAQQPLASSSRRHVRPCLARSLTERSQEIAARHDTDDLSAVGHRDSAGMRARDEALQLVDGVSRRHR